jgi:glycosyltransferase involved in cell wall biosynthesis
MVVIPNGIDTAHFCFDLKARNQLRSEWGVTGKQKLIGLVGRLDPMKDHQNFLTAGSLLLKKRSNVRFVCVGDGPAGYKALILGLSESLGLRPYLIWADARINVAPIYSALDLLICSSYEEGFSNVLGEAMACGVQCVATDVGDSSLIVADQGAVVPAKNPESLMAAMERLLDMQQHNPSLIRKSIADRFSVSTMVSCTEELLTQLMTNPQLPTKVCR